MSLVGDKKTLSLLAAEKVRLSGYNFKKKRSRSGELVPKRQCLTAKLREEKLEDLKMEIDELNLQIKLSEQQRIKQSNVQNYTQALNASQNVLRLKKDCLEKKKEVELLQKKEKNAHKTAKQRKKRKGTTNQQTTNQQTIEHFAKGERNEERQRKKPDDAVEVLDLAKDNKSGTEDDDLSIISADVTGGISQDIPLSNDDSSVKSVDATSGHSLDFDGEKIDGLNARRNVTRDISEKGDSSKENADGESNSEDDTQSESYEKLDNPDSHPPQKISDDSDTEQVCSSSPIAIRPEGDILFLTNICENPDLY